MGPIVVPSLEWDRDAAWLAAITPEQGVELIAAMESILPVKTLLKFYKAFRAADPAHALVQVRAAVPGWR
jgi:hypothetical protein